MNDNSDAAPVIEGYTELTPLDHRRSAVRYRAVDTAASRSVTIRVYPRLAVAESHWRSVCEGITQAGLHPAVLSVYDYGLIDNGRPYLVLEDLTDETVADRLAGGYRWRPREAAEAGRALAAGLAALHQVNSVHRRISPAEVFLRADGSPVLSDGDLSGLSIQAQRHEQDTLDGPAYAAPEQIAGASGDSAADIYRLGATVQAMIEGRPSRSGADSANSADGPLADAPSLAALLTTMTSVDPESRPVSAVAAGARFEQWLANDSLGGVGTPTPAPAPLLDTASTGAGRAGNRWARLAAVAAGLVLVGGIAYWLANRGPSDEVAVDIARFGDSGGQPVGELNSEPADEAADTDAADTDATDPTTTTVAPATTMATTPVDPYLYPGAGVRVELGRARYSNAYFLDAVYKALLEQLGYEVSGLSEHVTDDGQAYPALADGKLDVWPSAQVPQDLEWHINWDDKTKANVEIAGITIRHGGMRGITIDAATADQYDLFRVEDIAENPEISAMFDVTGDGVADVLGCQSGWGCGDVINEWIDEMGWGDGLSVIDVPNDTGIEQAVERMAAGQPTLLFVFGQHRHLKYVELGRDVYWLSTNKPPPKDNATADVGPDVCPGQPCNTGFWPDDLAVAASRTFLDENPAAAQLLASIEIPLDDVVEESAYYIEDHVFTDEELEQQAATWIEGHRLLVDRWLAKAREAATPVGS